MSIEERVSSIENSIKTAGLATKQTLTMPEAAAYAGVSTAYLYKLTMSRKIPHYKPQGKRIYFDRAELDAWLKSNRITPQAEIENRAASYCRTKKA